MSQPRAEEAVYLYLTTIGRRSGLPREIEIWFARRNGRDYVIAETGERAQWVRNLRFEPRVQWRVADVRFSGRARVIDGIAEPGLKATVQALFLKKYGWGNGLVVELIPDEPLPPGRGGDPLASAWG